MTCIAPQINSSKASPSQISKTTPHFLPSTPLTTPLRRSARFNTPTPHLKPPPVPSPSPAPSSRSRKSLKFPLEKPEPKSKRKTPSFESPTPDRTETGKKRKINERRSLASIENINISNNNKTRSKVKAVKKVGRRNRKRVYYRKVEYDGGEFAVGDDVYVKKREDASSDNEDPEVEECRVCFKDDGRVVMIECDDCLGGFHLKCLKPPLNEVPEGDWICGFCEAKKLGKEVEFDEMSKGRKSGRTAKEKLLTNDLYAARIER